MIVIVFILNTVSVPVKKWKVTKSPADSAVSSNDYRVKHPREEALRLSNHKKAEIDNGLRYEHTGRVIRKRQHLGSPFVSSQAGGDKGES